MELKQKIVFIKLNVGECLTEPIYFEPEYKYLYIPELCPSHYQRIYDNAGKKVIYKHIDDLMVCLQNANGKTFNVPIAIQSNCRILKIDEYGSFHFSFTEAISSFEFPVFLFNNHIDIDIETIRMPDSNEMAATFQNKESVVTAYNIYQAALRGLNFFVCDNHTPMAKKMAKKYDVKILEKNN